MLPDTDKKSARKIGERFRKKVEALTVQWNNDAIGLTVGGGSSFFP